MNATEACAEFRRYYDRQSRVFCAPGRINLIGEHTDYNSGFVMPVAINFYVYAAIAPRTDNEVRVRSANFSQEFSFNLEDSLAIRQQGWSDFVVGVAKMAMDAGCRLRGADLLIQGDIPMGAGLSSSAAIEVAAGLALLANSGLSMDRVELARLCQRAENEFVGARVGIMDQFVSCCGRAGHALELDCRSLEYRLLPLPAGVSLVICNTMIKHEHAGGEYNRRRAECEEGVRLLARVLPGIQSLRDVELAELEKYRHELPDKIYRRCRHVISENARVLQAASALQRGDVGAFGGLMGESHKSLRDDYEVSCAELDLMVELAAKQEGVYGSRMTGGGFGGSTISILENDRVAKFQRAMAEEYERKTGLKPQILEVSASDGATEVKI
jgi:galactokinase